MLKKELIIKFKDVDKQVKKVIIEPESYKISQRLKTEYAVAFRKAISMGVATRSSMLELLKKENVWTESNEQSLLKKTIEVSLLENSLEEAIETKNESMAKKVAIELAGKRGEIYELIQIKHTPLEHTAESIAEDVKLDVYIALCTRTEDGKPYFKGHGDFLDRRDNHDVQQIYSKVIEKLSENNIELLRKLPENKWLMDNNIIDKKGNPIAQELTKLLESEPLEIIVKEESDST